MFVVCLLALSVSLDTLGIGMAYAMSGICIPKQIRLFIALLNGVLTAVALFAGSTCLAGLPEPCFLPYWRWGFDFAWRKNVPSVCCKTKGKYSMTKIIPEALI